MLQTVMHPEMVYEYPIWAIGLSIGGLAVAATIALEFVVKRFVPASIRREHNDIAAAIFSVIGVTYAVLLAFVAMLSWEGFNAAKAASHHEAALLLDLDRTAAGFSQPVRSSLRGDLVGYTRAVIATEWPAQAAGRVAHAGEPFLGQLNRTAIDLRPNTQADANLHALLLETLTRLCDAREERLLTAQPKIPGVVWFVMLIGGGLTIAFGAFLGASSLRLHLTMSAMLAISGVLVLVMILALSSPFRGDFRVSTEPYETVLAKIATE